MGTLRGLAATAVLRAGALLAGAAVAAGAAGAAWGVQDVVLTNAAVPGGLTIEGSIAGVRAGAPAAPLRLTLHNDGATARHVTRVTAASSGVDRGPGGCAGHLRFTDWTGAATVPAGGATTVTVRVAVGNELPAECRTVTWGLVYRAY